MFVEDHYAGGDHVTRSPWQPQVSSEQCVPRRGPMADATKLHIAFNELPAGDSAI